MSPSEYSKVRAIAPGVNITSESPRRDAESVPVERSSNQTAMAAIDPDTKVAAIALVGQLRPVTAWTRRIRSGHRGKKPKLHWAMSPDPGGMVVT